MPANTNANPASAGSFNPQRVSQLEICSSIKYKAALGVAYSAGLRVRRATVALLRFLTPGFAIKSMRNRTSGAYSITPVNAGSLLSGPMLIEFDAFEEERFPEGMTGILTRHGALREPARTDGQLHTLPLNGDVLLTVRIEEDVPMARSQAADYDQRRDAIVAVAARLFAQRGFSETAVSDLAAACDMSKSLLYHYYSSKEEILYAVMSSHIDGLEGELEEIVTQSADPSQAFEMVIRRFLASYAGAGDRQKVLLNELDNLPADKRRIIVGKQRKIIGTVQAMVVALYPRMALKPARARAQTMLIFGMINWTHTWMNPEGPLSAGDIAEMVLDLTVPQRSVA